MDGDIQAHEINEGIVVTKAKQRSKVVGVVFRRVDGRELPLAKDVTIDSSRNIGELSDAGVYLSASRNLDKLGDLQVHGVFKNRAPIILFGNAFGVGFCKCRIVI
jgi:hypothetical protein